MMRVRVKRRKRQRCFGNSAIRQGLLQYLLLEEVLAMSEKQIFDRKSIQIKPVDLSDTICAFANADGGTIAIGISDKHQRIEGVDYHEEQMNEILRAPIDFCSPTVPVTIEMVECVNYEGKQDHVLLMHIEASPLLHANQADEAFLRVGDKSKKLDFNDRMTLLYAKGVRYYEDEPVADASIEDLDLDFVREYCQVIGYTKSPEEYVRENKKLVTGKEGKERVSVAAILLFGNSTFILKTIVMSASFAAKTTASAPVPSENASIEQNDASIPSENASIGQNDASIHGKDALIELLHRRKDEGIVSRKDAANAVLVIENTDIMQVITTKEIMKTLSCRTTKARMVLRMMEAQGLIKTIRGKGRYILNVSE